MKEKNFLWRLFPKLDSFVKEPGENLKITLTVQNLSDTAIYFSKAEIVPSWTLGKKGIKQINMKDYIPPNEVAFLTDYTLHVPSKAGLYTLKFRLQTWIYNHYTAIWENLGMLQTSDWGYIQVTPRPIYDVFISRSARKEDAPVVDYIVKLIETWGFNPITHGFFSFSEDPLEIPNDIKKEIDKCEAFIGIATPRYISVLDKTFRTFPWIHLESGMAFHSDKPLLFIVDERIKPEGLLEYPNFPKVFYHPTKLDILEHRLAVVMPGFREWIKEKKQNNFFSGLVKAGLIFGGIWLVAEFFKEKK